MLRNNFNFDDTTTGCYRQILFFDILKQIICNAFEALTAEIKWQFFVNLQNNKFLECEIRRYMMFLCQTTYI